MLIDDDFKKINKGRLCDLAPTILTMIGIHVPAEMSGRILIEEKISIS